jgi:hypothetical protein
MRSSWSFLSLSLANFFLLVSAHTQIWYPEWRNNSFNPPFSQTIYPCEHHVSLALLSCPSEQTDYATGAGISDTPTTNRTLWPLDGGSLNVTLHDDAAYIFINIGLGVNTTNFNISLFAQPLNETGAGNLCFPKLTLPSGLPIEDGTQASIQFATSGHDGEGLYNVRKVRAHSNGSLLISV